MKLSVTAVLCLSLLLVHVNVSLAGRLKLSNPFKKTSKTKPNLDTKTKANRESYPKQPTGDFSNQGGYPQQPARGYPQYPNPGGYPQQPGGGYPQQPARGYPQYPNPGGYPQQPGGGYPQQPARGYPQYPNPGGYPQYPRYPAGNYPAPGYTYGGGYGGYGHYPGSYINHNPNNKILSPRYGGSFGYGGYGGGGGSPFSHSVQKMGFAPSDKSKGFGRSAVMAAAGGAMAGMALGYGLGRFPRPSFHFNSPQEEYYYNYYMYKRYGVKSTDKDDYSRDYQFSPPPDTFDRFMTVCLKRTDLLSGETQRSKTKPSTTTIRITTTTSGTTTTTTTASSITTNTTAARNFSLISNLTNTPPSKSELPTTTPKALQILNNSEEIDDTVSIVEIGYPALIKQMKVKKCTGLFIVYSERLLKKKEQPGSGVQRLQMGWQGLAFVLIGTTMMLMNCDMLILYN